MPQQVDTAAAQQSLGVVAWSYLVALRQGRSAVASGLLMAFQEAYNTYGSSVRDAITNPGFLPRDIGVSGSLDENSRRALLGALAVGVAIPIPVAESMPSVEAELPSWMASLPTPASPIVRQAEELASQTKMARAREDALNWVAYNIEGIPLPVSMEPDKAIQPLPTELVTAARTEPGAQWPFILAGALGLVVLGGVGWTLYNQRRRR